MIERIKLWGHTERPCGYEIRAIFREEGKSEDINIEMTFPKKPDEKEIEEAVALHKERILMQISKMTKEEFISYLKTRKGEEFLVINDLEVFPCECGEPSCKGWILDGRENHDEEIE